jgi:UrcA family protein
MRKFVVVVRNALVAAALTASVPAFAESAPNVKVAYGDLDLSSAAGQRHLHDRLAGAARQVCEGNALPGSIVQPAVTACMKQAMARADTEFAAILGHSQSAVAAR